jgi:hypothetical protein
VDLTSLTPQKFARPHSLTDCWSDFKLCNIHTSFVKFGDLKAKSEKKAHRKHGDLIIPLMFPCKEEK